MSKKTRTIFVVLDKDVTKEELESIMSGALNAVENSRRTKEGEIYCETYEGIGKDIVSIFSETKETELQIFFKNIFTSIGHPKEIPYSAWVSRFATLHGKDPVVRTVCAKITKRNFTKGDEKFFANTGLVDLNIYEIAETLSRYGNP